MRATVVGGAPDAWSWRRAPERRGEGREAGGGAAGRRARGLEREGTVYKKCPTRVGLWPRKIPLVDELPNRPPVHPGEPRERANCVTGTRAPG